MRLRIHIEQKEIIMIALKFFYVYGIPALQPPCPLCSLAGLAAAEENLNSTQINPCLECRRGLDKF